MKKVINFLLVISLILIYGFLLQAEERRTSEAVQQGINSLNEKYGRTKNTVEGEEANNAMKNLKTVSEMAERCDPVGDISKLEEQIKNIIDSINDMVKDFEEMDIKEDEIEDLKRRRSALRTEIARLNREIGSKTSKRNNIQKNINEKITPQINKLNNKMTNVINGTSKSNRTRRQNENQFESTIAGEELLESIKEQIETKKGEIRSARTNQQRNRLRAELRTLNNRKTTVKAELDSDEKNYKGGAIYDDYKKYRNLQQQRDKLERLRSQKQSEINSLNREITALQTRLTTARVEENGLDTAIKNYTKMKQKLDEWKKKAEYLNKLLTKLKELLAEKAKDVKDEGIINDLRAKVRDLLGKWDDKIKPPSEPPGAPPSVPRNWGISVTGLYGWTNMSALNDYINWINTTYSGNIGELNTALGGSITVFYQLNSTIGIGASYEYLSASSEGTLTITAPPSTLDHSQTISANGFLGVITFAIPLEISNLEMRAVAGAGMYFSKYHETENGFDVDGTGTSFGYKVGLDINYLFTDGFGLCIGASYRGVSINQFENAAGNILEFVPAYDPGEDITANFSGFWVSLGFIFKF